MAAKNKNPWPFQEPNTSCAVHSLVTILTELFWLQYDEGQCRNSHTKASEEQKQKKEIKQNLMPSQKSRSIRKG
jgi:hypothetical protein